MLSPALCQLAVVVGPVNNRPLQGLNRESPQTLLTQPLASHPPANYPARVCQFKARLCPYPKKSHTVGTKGQLGWHVHGVHTKNDVASISCACLSYHRIKLLIHETQCPGITYYPSYGLLVVRSLLPHTDLSIPLVSGIPWGHRIQTPVACLLLVKALVTQFPRPLP